MARDSDLEEDLPETTTPDFVGVLLCCFATREEVVLPEWEEGLSVRADETDASGLAEVLCADLETACELGVLLLRCSETSLFLLSAVAEDLP